MRSALALVCSALAVVGSGGLCCLPMWMVVWFARVRLGFIRLTIVISVWNFKTINLSLHLMHVAVALP